MKPETPQPGPSPTTVGSTTRWLPLLLLAAAMATTFAMGWHRGLSLETIGRNYDDLKQFIAGNFALALAVYAALYILVVALSLPGGLVMTLSGGLLFGWIAGAIATVVAATIGATIVFLIARSSFGEALAARAGPWLSALREGFQENALSYLLFLRLVPAFPFFVVNLAPALLGVPLKTYIVGTFVGIIPGTVAFSVAGAGLGSVVEAQNRSYKACLAASSADGSATCTYAIDTSHLLTNELLAAFVVLGVVALLPVVLKRMRGRNG